MRSKSKSQWQPTAATGIGQDCFKMQVLPPKRPCSLSLISIYSHAQPEFIRQQKISAKMHLTPLLLLAATLALTSKALPTGLNPTETSPSSTSKGMHRCCPPFKPRNKHFPPPRLPCDPNCTTGKKAVSFSIRSRGQTHVLACCSC
jgi:hypothetical protein